MQKLLELFDKYRAQILYLFFGGVTTIINIGVFAAITKGIGWNYQLANFIAWIAAVLVAYLTNRVWVFGSRVHGFAAITKELGSFFFFRILTYVMEVGILFVGISMLHGNEIVWKVIDNIFVILINYVFSKLIIFREKM
ncbi:GtrA family protein [Periweissella cryptocerci]|uniref:GtrA family protein n=1 Tax=Periweissella cryptocerci TaxID=2506420 RepID=A0A4P6YSI7_9LACO|nr:GtrA family protein [Periweissella cryptocerci]QBO35583.1 GtrA family protein [Periweissella cryptocerci]